MEIFSITLDTLGTVFIAYSALSVHYRVLKEHKIDEKVFIAMRREQVLGVLGVLMIIAGFIIDTKLIIG